MYITIKKVFIYFVVLMFVAVSCLNVPETEEQRTAETEKAELAQLLENAQKDGLDIDTTALGVYYIVHDAGIDSLPTVQPGDTCYLEYIGYLAEGVVFDASSNHFANKIWKFIYKETDLIPGFDDGIALMKKGSKIDLIIPSSLAYGPMGTQTIPPYSTLIFSTTMHDVKYQLVK